MRVTIYHNPRCSKSRETLALLQERGADIEVVNYLETPLESARLAELLRKLSLSARDLLRTSEAAYRELDLADPAKTETDLIDAMCAHPELMQRPVVVAGDKARLGRPPESVLEILE